VDRGFEDQAEFYLQARAMSKDDEIPLNVPATLTIATDFVVKFCPWCGVRLGKWYKKSADALIRPGLKIPVE